MILNLFYSSHHSPKPVHSIRELVGFDVSLGKFTVEVGIDQSSSNVGFYIREVSGGFHIIGNCSRHSLDDPDKFLLHVQNFFLKFLDDCDVKLFTREKPLPYMGDRSSKVLHSVARFFDEWVKPYSHMHMFSGLTQSSFGKIYPNVWRKHVIDKKKGKGRSTSKLAVVEDLLDKYPEFYPYFNSLPHDSDYDGFEAMGILIGYKAEHGIEFNSQGDATSTILAGDREYTGHISLYYKFFNDTSEIKFNDHLANLRKDTAELPILELNPSKGIYDNFRVVASTYDYAVVYIRDPHMIKSFQMTFGDKNDFKHLAVIVIKTKLLNSGYKAFLRSHYYSELQTWF